MQGEERSLMRFQNVKFVKSVVRSEELPSFGPLLEIAVAGRSNVGKSTLLNHLFGTKDLVKTSSTPGKTKALNFFKVDEKWIYVDMPGYGYAAVSKGEIKEWSALIENYLNNRPTLKVLLFLLDIRREPRGEDLQMVEWIHYHHLPAILVLTKVDKVTQMEKIMQTKRITDVIKGLPYVHYSATQNQGRKELIALLREQLE
jgi:GTP-binding protein